VEGDDTMIPTEPELEIRSPSHRALKTARTSMHGFCHLMLLVTHGTLTLLLAEGIYISTAMNNVAWAWGQGCWHGWLEILGIVFSRENMKPLVMCKV
jgi:hypothetical protein